MREASKAVMRRNYDRRFATTYLVGRGIDIGCGGDPIDQFQEFYPLMTSLVKWDQEDGDGALLEGVPDENFDFVHSSHSLEHMADPKIAMSHWVRVLKPSGHMVILLPDEDMFEQGKWPSPYAGKDHVTSWTIYKDKTWAPESINVIEFFSQFPEMEILKIEKLDATYLYDKPAFDQTQTQVGECAIEIILRKRTQFEIEAGGRIPPKEYLVFNS